MNHIRIKIIKILSDLILFFICIEASGQNWPKIYGDDIRAYGEEIMESYDNGYFICGSILKDAYTFKFGWIIKTDVNGNVLWDNKFGDGIHENYFLDFDETIDNGLIISGATAQQDIENDPLFVKLNPCGEIEWCRIFLSDGFNAGNSVISIDNDEFLGMMRYYGNDSQNFRISLVKMDPTGEPLWIKHLAQEDSTIFNEDGYYLYLTSDSNYLVSGRCFSPALRPFFIKTDTTGEQLWDLKWPAGSGGWANQSVCTSNGMIYNASGLRFTGYPKIPYLLKFNENGEAINQYPLLGDTIESGGAKSLLLFNDTLLFTGTTWTDDPYLYDGYCDILKVDTLGNVLSQRRLIDEPHPPNSIIKTSDLKILVVGHYYVDGNWDIYMWKMNSDLEDDTLYTQPLTYDSLCPYQIISDTLDLNCSLFVNIDEIPTKEEYESTINISPNPAEEWIVMTLPEDVSFEKGEIFIYNIYGQLVKEINGSDVNRVISLNISSISSGMYIAILRTEKQLLAKGKFIVSR